MNKCFRNFAGGGQFEKGKGKHEREKGSNLFEAYYFTQSKIAKLLRDGLEW